MYGGEWLKSCYTMIIGITGTFCAGKGTIVEYLQKKGFVHYSVRGYINKEIERRGLPITRDNMVLVANDLRAKNSPSFIVEEIYKEAAKSDKNCIIESIRTPGEAIALKNKDRFYLFAVDAERKKRYSRSQVRNDSHSDNVSFEKFCLQEDMEMSSTDPNKQNVSKVMSMADFHFENDGTLDELHQKIDMVLDKISG